MDIKREGVAKKKLIRRLAVLLIVFAAVVLAGWRINQLRPAAPAVEMATILRIPGQGEKDSGVNVKTIPG